MAVTFGGYRYGATGSNVSTVNINPNLGGGGSGGAACNVGDWMILVMIGGSGMGDTNVPGDLSGWTIVRSFGYSTGAGAFETGVWMKKREAGETSYDWPLDGTGIQTSWHMVWYSGAVDAFSGVFWDRNGHGTSTTNVAPSVTTTVDNSVVVSISTERTLAAETDSQIIVDNGMTKQYHGAYPAGDDRNINIADKTIATAGVSNNTTWTYPNTQTNNGIAGHIWFTPEAVGENSDAPQIVGAVSTAYASGGGSLTLNVPSGYQTGDLLIAALRSQSPTATEDWANASFTRIGTAFVASSSGYRLNGFYIHQVIGTEPSSYTFTTATGARLVGAMFLVRGGDSDAISFYDGYGLSITGGRGIPSYLAHDPSLVIEFGGSEFSAGNNHVPTKYPDNFSTLAEVVTGGDYTTSSRTYMYVGSRELIGSTNTVGRTETDITWAVVAGAAALSIAIGAAGSETPTPPDFTAKIGDTGNILTDVKVRVGDTGGVLSQVSDMRAMVARYHNVSEMLAQDEIYWAHRGGSRDFPEMSSFAYGQSALLGYGCLELSLARTSDGVWFGLHDQDINRTSGTTGLGAASTMTWSQVQGYQILGSMATNNPSQPSRPYARLQDILEAYSEHLFVVDVKYANTYREELLNILDSYGGKERFVGKAYGPGTNSFATSCANRGYERWGYFYASDLPSLTAPAVNQWTLIGMDYTASQSDWNTLAGYRANGQRMMGHICPNPTAVATAKSYGAAGFMVSGVVSVKPT
jgi:hypothetical protein